MNHANFIILVTVSGFFIGMKCHVISYVLLRYLCFLC